MGNPFEEASSMLKEIFMRDKLSGVFSVALYGSVARNEAVVGWSDIDVLVFTEHDEIPFAVLERLRLINEEIRQRLDQRIPIVFRVHSRDEFPFYFRHESSLDIFSLLNYLQDVQVVYGEDIKERIIEILRKKGTANEVFAGLRNRLISIRHEIRSVASSLHASQSLTSNTHVDSTILDARLVKSGKIIDAVFDCAQVLLLGMGKHVQRKQDIVTECKCYFPRYYPIVTSAFRARQNWPNELLNEKEAVEFVESALYVFETTAKLKQINAAYSHLLTGMPDLSSLPYRLNVCAIVKNAANQLLIVQKLDGEWQFPQGGIDGGETALECLRRELKEELGFENVHIVGQSKHINLFNWPRRLQEEKGYLGQIQQFFVVTCDDPVLLDRSELQKYKWVQWDEITQFITREDLVEMYQKIRNEGLL